MSTRTLFTSLSLIWLACPLPLEAHRLDEYLQATRLSIERDRVGLEIDLTAGVDVAQRVLAGIDADHDGQISHAERDAYAQRVLDAIELFGDGRFLRVTLIDHDFPDTHEIDLGTGVIRLRASATLTARASVGRHQIYYRNMHETEVGAYLVNTLVPTDQRIEIARQRRDYAQHELTIEYEVTPDPHRSSLWWLLAGLAMVGVLTATRRPSIRFGTLTKVRNGLVLSKALASRFACKAIDFRGVKSREPRAKSRARA